jgi:hypothetical protein
MTNKADTYEPDLALIDAAADRLDDGDALANEAITVADNIISLTNSGEIAAACRDAKLAAKTAREAALAYERAADALQLEAYRQSGESVCSSGATLHRQRQDADNPTPIVYTLCPWLG